MAGLTATRIGADRDCRAGLPPGAGSRQVNVAHAGVYRRRVLILGGEGEHSAELEDDFHRFGVTVRHHGGVVTDVAGRATRTPWTTCPAAAAVLTRLVGTPLLASPFAVLRQLTLREHCTHMVDLAALAIDAAFLGIGCRRYDAEVTLEHDDRDSRDGRLSRDGAPVLRIGIGNGVIVSPERFAGEAVHRAASWGPAKAADAEELADLFVLTRAIFVSGGRLDHVRPALAADLAGMQGACFAFAASRAGSGRAIPGSIRDFTDNPEALLAGVGEQRFGEG